MKFKANLDRQTIINLITVLFIALILTWWLQPFSVTEIIAKECGADVVYNGTGYSLEENDPQITAIAEAFDAHTYHHSMTGVLSLVTGNTSRDGKLILQIGKKASDDSYWGLSLYDSGLVYVEAFHMEEGEKVYDQMGTFAVGYLGDAQLKGLVGELDSICTAK